MGIEEAAYINTAQLVATKNLARYNDYVYGLLSRGLPADALIMEVGAGLGDFTSRLQKDGFTVDVLETELHFHEALSRYARKVTAAVSQLAGPYDAIVAVNVLEHVEDDGGLLKEMAAKLKPGGTMRLYHPGGGKRLYSHFDEMAGHYRRYDEAEMLGKVRAAGLEPEECYSVDSVGYIVFLILKWLRVGTGQVTPFSMTLYDKLVFPASRALDPFFGRRLGRSLFVRARRPA